MRILDRYILKNFLISMALWFVVMMALRIITDLFVNFDEFAKLPGKSFWGLTGYILSYYGYHSLVYFTELGGVIIVASAAFTVARMNQTNELTAMLASGVSLHRVVWPIVIMAMLMGGLIILDQELLIPPVAHKLTPDRDDLEGSKSFAVRLLSDSNGTVWYSGKFWPASETMENPVVQVRDKDRKLAAKITGAKAVWTFLDGTTGWEIQDGGVTAVGVGDDAWPTKPSASRIWTTLGTAGILRQRGHGPGDNIGIETLQDVHDLNDKQYGLEIRAKQFLPEVLPASPTAKQIDNRGGTLLEPRFIFTTPGGQMLGWFVAESARFVIDRDGSRWELTNGRLFYPSDLRPVDLALRRSNSWLDFMSVSQLNQLLSMRRLPDKSAAQMAKHIRVTDPLNNLVMLLLGLPFILSRERNIKASAGLCILMVGAFFAFVYICRSINDLPPSLAAWLPILLFGPVAVVMQDSIKT